MRTGAKRIRLDFEREELPYYFVDKGCSVGAEIGVYKGAFTEYLCRAGLKIYAIDPWRIYKDYKNPKGQARLDYQYEHAQRTLAPYNCHIIRKTSMEALDDFEDESLDFIYIDGNHMFRYIAEDLFEWPAKVKKGGIISGHDYMIAGRGWAPCHVKYVVEAYTAAFHIKEFFITNESKKPRKTRAPSWLWIKE